MISLLKSLRWPNLNYWPIIMLHFVVGLLVGQRANKETMLQ